MDQDSFEKEPYLIEELRKGSKEAFAYLFRLYHSELCNYMTAVSGNSKISEDIVQQTYIKIWDNRSKLNSRNTNLKRYLFKIAYNQFMDRQRGKMRELKLLEQLKYEAYMDMVGVDKSLFEERLKRIEMEIDNLPDQCKKVFILSKREGLKYREISEQLHISIKTVEVHMSRALKHLRTQLTSFL